VPAPAVIPAPGTYFEVAAVKTLVVLPGLRRGQGPRAASLKAALVLPSPGPAPSLATKDNPRLTSPHVLPSSSGA